MARRIRAHDWTATPLGPIEGWSDRLRLMVETVLAGPHVSSLAYGPKRLLIYNDAAARLYGACHPRALGRPLPEVFPEGWARVAPLYARAFAGEAVQVAAQLLHTRGEGAAADVFDATLIPMRDDAGVVVAVYMAGQEVGWRIHTEEALRESEARQAFLLKLSDVLKPLGDPLKIQATATRVLGEQLGIARAAYYETDAGHYVIGIDYSRGVPPLLGRFPIDTFGQDLIEKHLEAPSAIVVRDVAEVHAEAEVRSFEAIQVGAYISVPLVKGGRFVAGLTVHETKPRTWTPAEIALVQETAERTWAAVERARAETALHESEERYRTLFEAAERKAAELRAVIESMGDAVYMGGVEGITLVNQPALDQLGFTTREELNRHVGVLADEIQTRDAETGAFIPMERQAFARALGGEQVVQDVRVRHRLSGEERVVRCSASPVILDGRVVAAVAVNTDITERRAAEERLRESEARFRHMADSAPALIWTTDAKAQVAFANLYHDHLFGRPTVEMLGEGWMRVVLEEDLDLFKTAFQDAFRARQTFSAAVRVRDRASQIRWLRCECVPRLDDAGKFLGYTCCGMDITEARQATEELEHRVAERTAELMATEETLRQVQKMEAIGQLTGGIAHDFNNMLQGVVGAMEMARRQISQDRAEAATRYLDLAHGAAERAAGLTRRLLAFARRQRLEPKMVDADRLIAGMADLIRRTMGPGIEVELRLCASAGVVLCDPNELESAILNLCINARDAMPEGGRLAIGTADVRLTAADVRSTEAAPGTYVEISVADTGTGMPPDVLERVFEPFFTTKPQGQGTGLGLSQAWGFARQSDGLVRIESTPGRGTAVRLFLPLHEGVPTITAVLSPVSSVSMGSETVLLIDDEDVVRRPAADRLRELGLTVLEARDGPEALHILASSPSPDLLVTDVGLPNGMNGRQLAEAMRERLPTLPVLFVTGYAGSALPPGVEVIGKPFKLDALARRVQAILAARRQNPDSTPSS